LKKNSVEKRVVNANPRDGGGTCEAETVVVAEADAALRKIQAQMLRRLGYRVLEAEDREEALRLAAVTPTIEFLLTDLGLTQPCQLRQKEADSPPPNRTLVAGYGIATRSSERSPSGARRKKLLQGISPPVDPIMVRHANPAYCDGG